MGQGRELYDRDFLGALQAPRKVRTRHEKRMARGERPEPAGAFAHVPLEAEVTLEAPVFETEERDKVKAGLAALFPDAVWQEDGGAGPLRGRARDLAPFTEILRKTRIRDAARPVLQAGVGQDKVMRFRLNKQAACAGRANFVQGPAVLGAVEVEVRAGDAAALAEELTWIEGESGERLFGARAGAGPGAPRRPGR